MSRRHQILTFLAGAETFHTLLHAYLSVSKRTRIQGHPAELLGIKVTPGVHAVAAVLNAVVAVGLGALALAPLARESLNTRLATAAD